jgi:hypothetical protein
VSTRRGVEEEGWWRGVACSAAGMCKGGGSPANLEEAGDWAVNARWGRAMNNQPGPFIDVDIVFVSDATPTRV